MFSGFGSFARAPQKFEDFFRCYPVAMMNDKIRKDDANYGGKIFLPPSALNKLSMLNIRYPMLFCLSSEESGKETHGGVLEFIAEEGRAYLPQWMMETLNVQPKSLMKISSSSEVPQGQFVKLEPQSVDFLDISDPKAVLENVLRNFSTLTIDDIIEIQYNNNLYRIRVLEVRPETPSRSICVIETDLVTDFAPPVGYVEPDYQAHRAEQERQARTGAAQATGSMSKRIDYASLVRASLVQPSAFTGEGQRLSGKTHSGRDENSESANDLDIVKLGGDPAPLRLSDGQLFFGFPLKLPREQEKDDEGEEALEVKPHFRSDGQSLRQSTKRKGNKDHDTKRSKAPRSPEVIQID